MIKQVECSLCGSNNYEVIYDRKTKKAGPHSGVKEGYLISEAEIQKPEKVFKCNSCGLVFAMQDERPGYYTDRYARMADKDYAEEEEGRRRASVKILKRIEKYKACGKLLDVGCANGFLLDEARRRGWEAHGVEPSKHATDYAKGKLNLNVKNGTVEEAAFPEGFFDAIVMLDVLEHLVAPKDTLLELRRILKNDGILYVSTPDIASFMSRALRAKWWGINKFHLFYFSKKTAKQMLDACGLRIKKYAPHVRIFSVDYWVKRIRCYSGALYRALYFISRIDNFGKFNLSVNLRDQLEILAVKTRKLDYLASSAAAKNKRPARKKMKTVVVLPAYNAKKTLKRTVDDIPGDRVDKIILVDDASRDGTFEMAKRLGIEAYRHPKNMGYGANQKTCYKKALEQNAEIVVMVHPDYQYDPAVISNLIEPIERGEADAVFGSRMMKGGALDGGMPLWKHNVNILLTALENVTLGTYLTEYHSGFRAYSANLLKTVNFELNSNSFIFDTEIIVQALAHRFKIEEIPIKTRYFEEASKIKFVPAVIYGLGILWTMMKYILHAKGIFKFRQFG